MDYRPFGQTGLDVSRLSIGAMRLPKDDDEAVTLLRRAIDAGCNYIDTSRGYGDSELKLAKALQDGYRDKVILSTKCSPWIMKEDGYTASADDTRRKIDDSMQRLGVDRLDFYLVWNITNAENFKDATRPDGMVAGIRKAMDEGLIDHIGVTSHAQPDVMRDIIDCGEFETITLSYHLLNRKEEAHLQRAHERGMGVIAMNPLAGGVLGHGSAKLCELLPESMMPAWMLGIKYVLDHPWITTSISGFSRMSDLENTLYAESLTPLSDDQRTRLTDGVAALEQGRRFCTGCEYCQPCEHGVAISWILQMLPQAELYDLLPATRERYARIKPEMRADQCEHCGACESKCTNQIDIMAELERAHALLAPAETPQENRG